MDGGPIICWEEGSKAKLSGPAFFHFVNWHEGAAIYYLRQQREAFENECPNAIKQTFLKEVMQQKDAQRVTNIYLPNLVCDSHKLKIQNCGVK